MDPAPLQLNRAEPERGGSTSGVETQVASSAARPPARRRRGIARDRARSRMRWMQSSFQWPPVPAARTSKAQRRLATKSWYFASLARIARSKSASACTVHTGCGTPSSAGGETIVASAHFGGRKKSANRTLQRRHPYNLFFPSFFEDRTAPRPMVFHMSRREKQRV